MDDSIARFEAVFGPGAGTFSVRSPGRVNLIGEHTDYNDGFVFPMAIEPHVLFVCRPRNDGNVRVATTLFPDQIVEFSVKSKIVKGDPKWSNYVRGVAAMLAGAGVPLAGMDALLINTLPSGGGLSSSAAVEVGTGISLLKVAARDMDRSQLALLCQKAEHEFAGVPCGIMDQTIVASGKAGHAMMLDCRDLSQKHVPINGNEVRIVIINSMVKHELSGGEYAVRRKQCEEGVAHFRKSRPQVRALRDVSMAEVEAAKPALSDVVFRRCRHVVGENARTTEAATLLERGDYTQMGKLMVQSHVSLRDDYEVSCPELDFIVDEAVKVNGVYGARMTGGGFGGCAVALVRIPAVQTLKDQLTVAYQKKYNLTPTIFATAASPGASVVA